MFLNQLPLKQRLIFGFGVVLLVTSAAAILGWVRLGDVREGALTAGSAAERALQVAKWQGLTSVNVARTMAIAQSGGQASVREHFEPLMKATSTEITALQKNLEQRLSSNEERAQFAAIADKRQVYVRVRNEIFEAIESGQGEFMVRVNSELLPAAEAYLSTLQAYERAQDLASHQVLAESDAVAARAQKGQLYLSVLCVLLGMGMAYVIARSVIQPLQEVVAATRTIATGDLTQPIRVHGKDEVAEVLASLAHMQTSLQRVVGDVRHATDSIATASAQVSAGGYDLSARTEMAASNLQETAASVEQISGTIRSASDSAQVANGLANGAAMAASEGGEVVSRVVATMNEIAEGSRRIADIIGVIDSIAFQTNILALNAAVEAARAGEQGRGFAVVASEVRALAHRVADAAKEIKVLISTSVDQVGSGSQLVQEAGTSMSEIVSAVKRVTDVIGEISSAAGEQSSGIAQINVAVAQLDQMTQQNAALVEESTAAAASLKDQATRLTEVVSVFRLPATV